MLKISVSADPLTESNCYILSEGGYCVIIDPGESDLLVKRLKGSGRTPELALLTHEHCDHMAGLDKLRGEYPDMKFKATAACNSGIRNRRLNMSRIMGAYLHFRGKPGIDYEPLVCRPADEVIPDDAVFRWREHTLRLVPLPGHTPGSGGIFLDEAVFFSGDYLIRDEEVILRFPGGDEEIYREITEPILRALPDGILICPGHGEQYFRRT